MYKVYEQDNIRANKLLYLQRKLISHSLDYQSFLLELKNIYTDSIDEAVSNDKFEEVKILNAEYKEKYEEWHFRYFRNIKPKQFCPININLKEK